MTPFAQTINQEETKGLEKRLNSQQFVLHCLGLYTQNSGLREVDLGPSPKIDSDKIKKAITKKKEHNRKQVLQPGLTNENPAFREVDLERQS